MKTTFRIVLSFTLLHVGMYLGCPSFSFAQETGDRTDKLYSMSGIGFSFPLGETADYFSPKISTSLGANLGLGNRGLFLYPKVSLHAFGYNQQINTPSHPQLLRNARATTYLLQLHLGYRKRWGATALYGYLGGGGGIILTPKGRSDSQLQQIQLSNQSHRMLTMEAGAGIEYALGGAVLFLETGWMHGFQSLEKKTFHTLPLAVGIKPNLSRLLNSKK